MVKCVIFAAPLSSCLADSQCGEEEACIANTCTNPCTTSTCATSAICITQTHRATCICPHYFTGDPYVHCERISSSDENLHVSQSVNSLPQYVFFNSTLAKTHDKPKTEKESLNGTYLEKKSKVDEYIPCLDSSQCSSSEVCKHNVCMNLCNLLLYCGKGMLCKVLNHVPMCLCIANNKENMSDCQSYSGKRVPRVVTFALFFKYLI